MAAALPLALTQGDPAGIGPELTVRAWLEREARGISPFIVIGDPALYAAVAHRLGADAPIRSCSAEEAATTFATAIPVLPTNRPGLAEPGGRNPLCRRDHRLDRRGGGADEGRPRVGGSDESYREISAVRGRVHPSWTHGISRYAGGGAVGRAGTRPVMMIWSPKPGGGPATIHVPLRQVPDLLTQDLIEETARIVDADMRRRFGLVRPRIAVSGLNPHAGEGGALGAEDDAVVRPAVEMLRAEGLDVRGPLPQTPCSMRGRARATTSRFACTTTRR